MNIKKNIGFVVGGGISVVLILVAAGFLVINLLGLNLVKGDLADRYLELQRLETRDSFPRQENVIVESKNARDLADNLLTTVDLFSRQQSESAPVDNVSFGPLLNEKDVAMRKLAKAAGVKLAATFSFGFDRYAAGAIPSAVNAPRLGNQLLAIEQVFGVLCRAGVSRIDSVSRDSFDVARRGKKPPRNGGAFGASRPKPSKPSKAGVAASYVDPAGLYSSERVSVSFQAKESQVWAVLDALATSERFMVVKDIQTSTGLPVLEYKPAGQKATWEASADKTVLPHEQRVVAGGEMVTVILGVDVVRFEKKIPGVSGE